MDIEHEHLIRYTVSVITLIVFTLTIDNTTFNYQMTYADISNI